MIDIDKRFQGVHALKKCNLELRKGEVHALVGENGAGKSTLMKCLTGIHKPEEGRIVYNGKEVSYKNPKEAQEDGISIVHQELNLMNHLTAAQNIFIGRESKGFMLNDSIINQKTQELFDHLKLNISPTEKVGNLTVGKQQMVEISKAISFDSSVLILDEPTAALTETEIRELFRTMNDLRARGVTMVYISHRMDEIMEMTDRITVMRDGEYITTLNTKETNLDEIINAMVGRTIYAEPKTHSNVAPDAPVVLEAKNLVSKDVKDVSFQLHKGEILGLAGLMGAGRTETARLIFGADPRTSGEIYKNGQQVTIRTPQDAVKAGIGYLSEDRKRFGLAIGLSIADNTILAAAEDFCKMGVIDEQKVRQVTEEYIKKINIKTPSISQLIRNLSGGNQQKVIIAKWLVRNCDVLIFDEPTRGIDVGAKSEIYKLMNDLAAEGKSIIMISSELEEVLRMSDRIICMCEGRLTKVLDIQEASQEVIMKYATMRN
ncbi:sugar ABC transporter ATP-binding protein [bacterium 1XD42-1]|nr:sugar ABC transporter ATP-binding protein [Oscillospiraceae bacterium]RKJ56091.1 sugar ABC transporter ATP-binding protein [bacterium 1XD42-8]RKJ65844.1 sugar ABC transporter ATP-binding protein [bacterium 1XD42-1]